MKFRERVEAEAEAFFTDRGFSLEEVRKGSRGEKIDDKTLLADLITEALMDFESEYPVAIDWVLPPENLVSRKKSYRARNYKTNRRRK